MKVKTLKVKDHMVREKQGIIEPTALTSCQIEPSFGLNETCALPVLSSYCRATYGILVRILFSLFIR